VPSPSPKNTKTHVQPDSASHAGAHTAPASSPTGSRDSRLTQRAAQVLERCKKLATFSEDPAGIRRTFLSPPMRDCHREVSAWLTAAGAEVRVDAVGNLRAFYSGAAPSAPRLLLGSHLDTVPNAGAYDGILGVVLAVALVESLAGRRLPFAIEVVAFSEEEGVRFGTPFIGSRALIGTVDQNLLEHRDANGISIREAIEDFGLEPSQIPDARLSRDALAYVEFHIEQGPVLESLALPLAAVDAIVAQTRMELIFLGRANHAGTTPMRLRHDALAAAAEWIVDVERAAQARPGLIATVGRIEAKPGAVNVIAQEARATLDVRHPSEDECTRSAVKLVQSAEQIAKRRGLLLEYSVLSKQKAVPMDPWLTGLIERAIQSAGGKPHRMVSGAGHDAMILAEKIPAAMIFMRSPGGISHHPAESVLLEDVARALECGMHLLEQLADSSEFVRKITRR
jgi:allantoate deiminase